MSEIGVVKLLMDELRALGWMESNLCPKRVRGSVFIEDVLKNLFKELNGGVLKASGLQDKVDKVFDKVKSILESAEPHTFLEYLRRGVDVEEGGKSVRVKLVDYDRLDSNVFTVCREVEFYGERMDVKPDLVLYVNGVPLVIIEVKDPSRLGERAIEEGLSQLKRYEEEVPGLFKYIQLGIVYVGAEDSVYMPMLSHWKGRERAPSRWRDESGRYNILELLRRDRLLDIIRWFTFYKGADKKSKIIPRYNQYWATVKAVERIRKYLAGEDSRNRGLIWHWQGSGKTYIMFYIAYQFYQKYIDRDPIVFFIVDRRELQKQLYEDFIKDIYAPYFQEETKIIESIEELRRVLRDIKESEKRGTIARGVYVVLIQKFRPKEFEDLEPIMKKEVLLLLDEAHRSQYGELGATLNKVFPNAIRFAFTGTPVMEHERDTFKYFAYPELGELYLHKYFISDSIRDGYTVPLKYQVVQEIGGVKINVAPEEIKSLLDAWAKSAHEVGSIDDLVDEEEEPLVVTKQEIKRRLNKIKVFLENPERIRMVAGYIVERILEDTENFTYKAMVVVASRLACVRMKKALDAVLEEKYGDETKRWSEIVMVYTNNDPKEIREYLNKVLTRWRGSHGVRDWQEVNRIIQDKFKEEGVPRILIVTDMLITGFDCPRLKVMYLDKPLYEHRLLQAIARVNRPYKQRGIVKEFGLVVDFVGLIDHVKDAIRMYELLDHETYTKIYEESIIPISKGLEELYELVNNIKHVLREGVKIGNHLVKLDLDEIVKLVKEGKADKAFTSLESAASMLAVGYSIGDPKALFLLNTIKRIVNLYRALGANSDKLALKDYVVIAGKLYNLFLVKYRGRRVPQEFWQELLKMVHERTIIPDIELIAEYELEPVGIEEALEKLKTVDLKSPHAVHIVADILSSIRGLILSDIANPVYLYIYERLKKLEEEWASKVHLGLLIDLFGVLSKLKRYRENREKMGPAERIVYDVKEALGRKLSVKVEKLDNFEKALAKVFGRYEKVRHVSGMRSSDRMDLKVALLRDLFSIGSRISPREKEQIAEELLDYVERAVIYELRRQSQ